VIKIKEHKEGIIVTIIFHVALLIILLISYLSVPLPLPEERGVLIDFGYSEDGMGLTEPTPKDVAYEPGKTQESVPSPPVQQKVKPVAQKIPPAKPVAKNEDFVTQDFEKTAALEAAKKKADEKKIKDSLQQVENVRNAEAKRIAEIKRQDSLRKVAEQAKIDQINSRAKNVFGGSSGSGAGVGVSGQGSGSGVSGQGTDPNSSGHGATYKPGNQGSPDGVAGGGLNGGGSGTGSGKGTGVSYKLAGRNAKSLPKPAYPGNEEAVVVVEVTVDKAGKVTKAVPGAKGSTSLNTGLMEAAKKAALQTRFDENQEAPELQTGLITYRFVLD